MATLKVTVYEARDLPIMDRTTGLADPYVVVRHNDLEYTTEVVHMSRHPVWNTVFRIDTPDLFILQEDPLEVRLYDHDIISRDDIVGHTFIDCNSMVLQTNPSMSGWFPLFDTSEKGIRGEIRLALKIKFHTAENPLAPRLPTRYTLPLPPIDGEQTKRSEDPPPSPSMLPNMNTAEALEPLRATRMQHPSITAEEEGILIFSAWRLDPSVYRIESVLTMVEELIVKADPEHSKLSNLRSTRTINEARIVQLYKLSGKVRRQLARKVVEMQCNAVLGYVEEFDMESNGIIVRAYGTPCVLSAVKYFDREKTGLNFSLSSRTMMKPAEASSGCMTPALGPSAMPLHNMPAVESIIGGSNSQGATQQQQQQQQHLSSSSAIAGAAVVVENTSLNIPESESEALMPAGSCSSTQAPLSTIHVPTQTLTKNDYGASVSQQQQQLTVTGTRTNVLILTLKDLPAGMVEHIGGYISARSVKIVAKVKSKQMISQERDAWWMELREELKANARAFHCNVILGYEEVVMYHEDVAVLSLSGTAVILTPTMYPLRCGPEFLYQLARNNNTAKKNCSMLHLYHPNSPQKEYVGDLEELAMCNMCLRKPVPDVLLLSCSIPQDIACNTQPRLVQAVVTKSKNDVRGVDLALSVSQALPYIEYSLHKQLLFNMKLLQLNAVFGLRITLCITSDTIIGTLTGTGFRLVALPLPSLPRVKILDPAIRRNEVVMRLEEFVAQRHRLYRRQVQMANGNSAQHEETSSPRSSEHRSGGSSDPSDVWDDGDDFNNNNNNNNNRGLSSDSETEQEFQDIGRVSRAYDYVLKIDDEEEAEMMLGMTADLTFEDNVLLTIPYMPVWSNAYGTQKRIVIHRRYAFQKTHNNNNGSITVGRMNECFANAKKAFVQLACRVAMRGSHSPLERLHIMGFTFNFFFEPNTCSLQLRLEGCLMICTGPQQTRLLTLEDRSFKECLRRIEYCPVPVSLLYSQSLGGLFNSTTSPTPRVEASNTLTRAAACSGTTLDGGSTTPTSLLGSGCYAEKTSLESLERGVFVMSNAPFSLPFVFKRVVVPHVLRLNEGANTAALTLPDVHGYCKNNKARPGMVERQWHALTSLASTAIRNLMEKTGVTSDGKGGVDTRHREGATDWDSAGSGGGPMLHQPLRRISMDLKELNKNDPCVIFTPLDFVAGRAIARYVGRLSQHFIRESYEIHSSEELGVFFQQTEFEMQCLVQAMVCLMGGDALLKHRVTFHEVWDSDGSGSASVFVTVTGDVVQTSTLPIVPLPSNSNNNNVGTSSGSGGVYEDEEEEEV